MQPSGRARASKLSRALLFPSGCATGQFFLLATHKIATLAAVLALAPRRFRSRPRARMRARSRSCGSRNTQIPRSLTGVSGRRYYNPSQGRFLGRDPIQEQGGLNLYGFCGNDSVNRWDLLGMKAKEGEPAESDDDCEDGLVAINGIAVRWQDQWKLEWQRIDSMLFAYGGGGGASAPQKKYHVIIADEFDDTKDVNDEWNGNDFWSSAMATQARDKSLGIVTLVIHPSADILKTLAGLGVTAGTIDQLSIVDHGKGNTVILTREIDFTTVKQEFGGEFLTAKTLGSFTPLLSTSASVILYGCYVGKNDTYLNELAQAVQGHAVWTRTDAFKPPTFLPYLGAPKDQRSYGPLPLPDPEDTNWAKFIYEPKK